jgi:hypothetical protein
MCMCACVYDRVRVLQVILLTAPLAYPALTFNVSDSVSMALPRWGVCCVY